MDDNKTQNSEPIKIDAIKKFAFAFARDGKFKQNQAVEIVSTLAHPEKIKDLQNKSKDDGLEIG